MWSRRARSSKRKEDAIRRFAHLSAVEELGKRTRPPNCHELIPLRRKEEASEGRSSQRETTL